MHWPVYTGLYTKPILTRPPESLFYLWWAVQGLNLRPLPCEGIWHGLAGPNHPDSGHT